MPSLFRKKSTPTPTTSAPAPATTDSPRAPPAISRDSLSPEKKNSKRDKRPKSPRTSRSFARRKNSETDHPLNSYNPSHHHYDSDLRRLSAVSAMSSPPLHEDGGVSVGSSDPMETTPAPETPGAFPQPNGVNGDHHMHGDESESGPVPPPHKTPSPQPPVDRTAEAEAFKAQGNQFYKAQQYDKAIEEYSKGLLRHTLGDMAGAGLTWMVCSYRSGSAVADLPLQSRSGVHGGKSIFAGAGRLQSRRRARPAQREGTASVSEGVHRPRAPTGSVGRV